MKYVLIILCLAVSGCSGIRVNVDYTSCHMRGELDGKQIADCKWLDVK